MMDEIRRALLGDKATARRLTDAGKLLPCPMCGKYARFDTVMTSECGTKRGWKFQIGCSSCKHHTDLYEVEAKLSVSGDLYTVKDERPNAILEWNTRAPILSAEEMEELSYGQFTTKPN